ncbi:unnamed protein product [Phytophthora lilii]|uniref:non-specific serine/threonine protein kinase n=1 Tax=Phytophthora lilii TaxID=2077276 RepID=A0A9W6U563_9STRA|nr:unnamed protein product [Phytophthora lilii]
MRDSSPSAASAGASASGGPPLTSVSLSDDALAAIEQMAVVDKRAPPALIEASAVSDTTMSSSDRCSSCSSSDSSAGALDDDYGAHVLSSSEEDDLDDDDEQVDDEEEQQDATSRFLVKPMPSRLQVCPVDDMAVEDEKRRRRSRRNLKNKTNGKNAPLNGASRDAESLPSTPSPIMVRTRHSGSSPVLCTLDTSVTSTSPRHSRPSSARERKNTPAQPPAAVGSANETILAPAVPLLRKDSAAIRRQYWSQLGFSLSRSDLEKSTGRKKERREGLKVRLNDADSKDDHGAKGFLRFITSWYAPITALSGEEKARKDKDRHVTARQLRSSLSRMSAASSSTASNSDAPTPKKGVRFNEEAELFYIPLHRDYSKRQRDCMWPTRAEFVAMVERNLDAVYDEMEREYEAQLENEYLENEGMAREEARQRTVEAQQRKAAQSAADAQAAAESRRSLSPPLSRSSSTMSSVPTLTLSQKQVLVSPRARSSHDLRFNSYSSLTVPFSNFNVFPSATKKGPPSAAKKTRNRKKKGRGAAPAPPASAVPAATSSSSPDALEEAESGSSQSVEGSNSTARRSFSPLSGSSSQRCSSEEEEEDYEEDDYSSESEEEGESSYKPGGYHRVQVGEVYNSRFEVLQKLGWGHFSTVWKCLDRQTGEMVAMKVQKSARHYTEAAKDEIELLECTVHAARTEYESVEQQEAIKVVRLVDSFEHKGPNGMHVCMVFEMMGDNLLTLIKYYNYRGVPMKLVQRLTRDMMEGLAFLHDKCQIIHTDLKPENVLLSHHIPQLPKIRKSQWEEFRAMRLARCQKEGKASRNGSNTHAGGATPAGAGAEMSKEDKKRLKNRLKKKRQKQRKQGGAAEREVSADGNAENVKMDSTARPTLTTSDSTAVDKLSNRMSKLEVTTRIDNHKVTDDDFKLNFAGQEKEAASEDVNVDASRTWYHQVGQLGDEEDKDWVHLPPEFAARVMLLLPEGRVAGSKRKEREFTLSVATKSQGPLESDREHEKQDDVKETSFVLRYLDHVDDDVMSSIEEQIFGLDESCSPRKAFTSTKTKYRLWRLEFDARYTHAVLDYLERRIEGLRFLNLLTSSGVALPGFFLPAPPSSEDIKSAAKAKAKTSNPDNGEAVLHVVIQGINLLPFTGSVDKKFLEVKPLQERLGRWASRFNKLANSEMFNLMKLDAKICDLGNACWTTKHFTNDIQTRQYRCPEVILGKRYDTSADIWSMACFVFELLTGDLLFDPKSGRNFNRDEDHLAQMIELLGRMPKSFTGSQRGLREFFNRKGDLKRIQLLNELDDYAGDSGSISFDDFVSLIQNHVIRQQQQEEELAGGGIGVGGDRLRPGPDPKVLEFIAILKEYRLKCEEDGNYLEAQRADSQLTALRRQEFKRQSKSLKARQIAERQDVQIAHNMQFNDFNQAWDQYMEEYDRMAQAYVKQMTEKHAADLAAFQDKLQQEILERPPKFSKELIEWRRRQHRLAQQKSYAEAQKIKQIADEVEADERAKMSEELRAVFARKEAKLRQQQQAELAALLKRIDGRRKEHLKQRNLDSKRLLQRNRNVQSVLESKQVAEAAKKIQDIKMSLMPKERAPPRGPFNVIPPQARVIRAKKPSTSRPAELPSATAHSPIDSQR